jgi:hypothetical protein
MAFPSNPDIGTSHTIGSKTWYWDGSTWTLSLVPATDSGDVEVLDDLLDVDTGGPPTSSQRAYNYYIQEDPVNENAWGRYSVDLSLRTVRFHRYDIDGNDLKELYDFSNSGDDYTEGTKHSAQALDESFDEMSRILGKTTDDETLYYEFTYDSYDFVNSLYNNGTSKLFTLYATDFGALVDGAILVYRQSEELWKPEPHDAHGGDGSGAKVYISSTPPPIANEGDLWIHEINYYMYVRKGGEWIALTGPEGGTGGGGNFANDSKISLNNRRGLFFNTDDGVAGGIEFTLNQPKDSTFSISTKNIVSMGMVPHSDPVDSDIWIFEEDYTMYVYRDGQWIALTGKDMGSSAISGRLEQPCVLNGGKPFSIFCEEGATDIGSDTSVHISPMPPEYPKKGSLWFDSEHLELRVYYVSAESAPVWVSTTHPAMRPQYGEPVNQTPIIITGPKTAITDTITAPYRAVLSQEVQADPNRGEVIWDLVDYTIPADFIPGDEDIYTQVKYHGFGVTFLTAKVRYTNYDGNDVTAYAEPYRVSITKMAIGAPIVYNVKVVEDPDDKYGLVYEIDGVIKRHLNLERNRRHIFNQSHPSNAGHPLYFYTALNRDDDGNILDTININDKYEEGRAVDRYGDIVEITMPHDAPARLAYGSETNTDMGFWVYPFDVGGAVFDPENPNNYPYP